MTAAVVVDAAGAQMGGAARCLHELHGYLGRTGRSDVQVIGSQRRVTPGWLVRWELAGGSRDRRVALNNVGFVAPGGRRWTLLRNALHFLTEAEKATLPQRPCPPRSAVTPWRYGSSPAARTSSSCRPRPWPSASPRPTRACAAGSSCGRTPSRPIRRRGCPGRR